MLPRYSRRSFMHRAATPLVAAVLLTPMLANSQCELRSPSHRLALLELYTSEGCSSCPPADRWLSRLRTTYSGQQIVALAFHVDYWNQLGWPDRFSHSRYTQRQQQASTRNRADFVYTPQFLLDGKDVRPVHAADGLNARLRPINKERARAHIVAQAALTPTREIELRGNTSLDQPGEASETYIAVYENAITSKVASGENAGKTLQHDFVVRALLGPVLNPPDGITKLEQKIPLPADVRHEGLGIAVFVQDRRTGVVLQAAAAEGCFTQ